MKFMSKNRFPLCTKIEKKKKWCQSSHRWSVTKNWFSINDFSEFWIRYNFIGKFTLRIRQKMKKFWSNLAPPTSIWRKSVCRPFSCEISYAMMNYRFTRWLVTRANIVPTVSKQRRREREQLLPPPRPFLVNNLDVLTELGIVCTQ